jgi:NifU-like protein involved in Fe-S cluster formation
MNIINRCKYIFTQKRFYDNKVVQHFNNPKNIGTLDKNDTSVGTGLVGAPACFHGDTRIAISNGVKTLKQIYEETNKGETLILVWSFNISKSEYELKPAKVCYMGKKELDIVILSGRKIQSYESSIICTHDHKFLIKDAKYEYLENNKITNDMDIITFKKDNNDSLQLCFDYNLKIKSRNPFKMDDCYTLQVEENNNYCIIDKEDGIVVKNCGDVMKLQIKVDENGNIIDAKTKVFGCASAIASSSLATELIIGKNIIDAEKVTNNEISTHLNLPPVKKHCSLLAEDSIKAAIQNFKNKNKK